jgi:catechol 2,3-dioxygenase-like lactoylglutathione lyase family enzyme
VKIESFDHVALWVGDPDAVAGALVEQTGVHVVDRTERFTLVGGDARRGKLTLFAAEGPREAGRLARIGLRVPSLKGRPPSLALPDALHLELVETPADEVVDLDHVVLRVPDPAEARESFLELGLEDDGGRLRAGRAWVDLVAGGEEDVERPLLNHLGLLVESAEEHLAEAERRGLDVADVVDAPNTLAVFVRGPAGIVVEYVEHKASFSLV